MNNVLIVCKATDSPNGGTQCINRNIESIEDICGKDNTLVYKVKSHKITGFLKYVSRLREIFKGYFSGLNEAQEGEINNLIQKYKIDILYIDGSFYGKLAKVIKKQNPQIRIITFFHNCEFDYNKNQILSNKSFWALYNMYLALKNEKHACKYSDKIIVLNTRDKEAVFRYYKRLADYIIPITFKPWYKPVKENLPINKPLHAIFVGSYFYGNNIGLKWFCERILPRVNIHLTVVGAGMEKLITEITKSEKLVIQGRVPDLTQYYEKADIVLLPIITGGGDESKNSRIINVR